jgi:hypothetical protein
MATLARVIAPRKEASRPRSPQGRAPAVRRLKKKIQDSLSHQMFGNMYEVLNIDEKKLIT